MIDPLQRACGGQPRRRRLPGVLIAAFIVKSLPIGWLRWLVVIAVLYAAALMLRTARAAGTAAIAARRPA